jgi:hypothetical protein
VCRVKQWESDIWRAAEAGDVGEVERLVRQDPGLLNAKGLCSWTPLMYACRKGRLEVVRWLVANGAAIDHRAHGGSTALCQACVGGRAPVVMLLVERGADLAIVVRGGVTPLMYASAGGHVEVLRFLLGHPSVKSTINRRNVSGRTGLYSACGKALVRVVRVLLENGADPTIPDRDGRSPLSVAKSPYPIIDDAVAEDRRGCVAALEVRSVYLPVLWSEVPDLAHGGRRRSEPTCCGRPGRWLTSRGAARWRWRKGRRRRGRRGRRERRCYISRCTA